ncbi:helix-turn-helix domain-containing protein [Streptomyces sp. NPDC002922]|uniref:helix-turn-helix domain-containing protein n=1 Tax=Streptomyces sp. NPDC002922 TaxID=3154439 RepID=UPI0033BEF73E
MPSTRPRGPVVPESREVIPMACPLVCRRNRHERTAMGRWILQQRLERCRRDLPRVTAMLPTVAAVSRRWGFVSPSHFSRVFRAAYGMSPREWKMAELTHEGRQGQKC